MVILSQESDREMVRLVNLVGTSVCNGKNVCCNKIGETKSRNNAFAVGKNKNLAMSSILCAVGDPC